jgi:hypothetical protein
MKRDPQAGAALIVILVIVVALLAAGGVAIFLGNSETRSAGYVAEARRALYCAEAGLAAGRAIVSENRDSWNDALGGTNPPGWYPITGFVDVAGGTVPDYRVTIVDNGDEADGVPNDPTVDTDSQVFVVARCEKYPDTPRTIVEMVSFTTAGFNYRNQSGQGAGNTGNTN